MKNKFIKIICFIVVLIMVSSFSAYYLIKNYATNLMINYLIEKYDADKTEFEVIDYSQGHYFFNLDDIGLPKPEIKWSNFKWQVKRADREFFVIYDEKYFYDDFQLEDIEIWATDWFKENIDHSIVGIGYSSLNIINHQKTLGYHGNNYIYKKDTIVDFIENCSSYADDNEENIVIVYFDFSSNNSDKSKMVMESIKTKFPNSRYLREARKSDDTLTIVFNKKISWNRKFISENEAFIYE